MVDVADSSDVDMGFSTLVFSTSSAYGESAAAVVRRGGGGGRRGVEKEICGRFRDKRRRKD